MITVLLTDGEFTGMIRSLRELGDIRIIGFCFSEHAAHRALLDRAYVAPSHDDEAYLPFLLQVIREEHVDFVFPIVTGSLPWFAGRAEEIREKTNAVVITSSLNAVLAANDKSRLFSCLKDDPATSRYVTDFALAGTMRELYEKTSAYLCAGRPCVYKPVVGENREGFFKVTDDASWIKSFTSGDSSCLTCPSQLKLAVSDEPLPVPKLIMPYLPGQEWDVDVLVHNGRLISATVRKNLDMFGGLSACTQTSDDPRLLDACRRILSVLGLNYLACISFKEDENGNLKLLEINPRAMGSIYVSALGGNNLTSRLLSLLKDPARDPDLTFRLTPPGLRTSLYYDILKLPS